VFCKKICLFVFIFIMKERINLLIEKIKFFLSKNYYLHQFYIYIKSRKIPNLTVNKKTKICIEAFPRSGNSWTARVFRHLLDLPPYTDIICHHTHSPHTVRKSLNLNIPTLVIIRNPIDAISSVLLFRKFHTKPLKDMISLQIKKYIFFYSIIKKYSDKIVIIKFEQIFSDFNKVIKKLNNFYGTTFPLIKNLNELSRKLKEEILLNSPNRDDPMRLPIPTKERKVKKAEIINLIKENLEIKKALKLYHKILDKLEG